MNQIPPEMVEFWQQDLDLANRALEEIATGKAHRPHSPIEILNIQERRDHLTALIAMARTDAAD